MCNPLQTIQPGAHYPTMTTRIRVLTSVLAAALIFGCGGRRERTPPTPPAPTSAERAEALWFCQTDEAGAGWDCERDAELAARPRPTRLPTPAAPQAPTPPPPAGPELVELVPLETSAVPSVEQIAPAQPDPVKAPASPSATPQPQPPSQPDAAVDETLPLYQRLAYVPDRPVLLTDLPGEFYAVQLVAMSTKEDLETWASQHDLQGFSAALVENDDGERYFVLLLGVYRDRQTAERAAAALPDSIKDVKPWVRPMAHLQAAMVPIQNSG